MFTVGYRQIKTHFSVFCGALALMLLPLGCSSDDNAEPVTSSVSDGAPSGEGGSDSAEGIGGGSEPLAGGAEDALGGETPMPDDATGAGVSAGSEGESMGGTQTEVVLGGTTAGEDTADEVLTCEGCTGRQTCDGLTGLCREPEVCGDDNDCLTGRVCEGDVCGDGCGVFQCPGEQVCDEAGERCTEATPCVGDGGCFVGRICVAGGCEDRCGEDADCPGRQSCDFDTGLCIAPSGCLSTMECAAGQVCAAGSCVEGCANDNDCSGAQTCLDGACQEPNVCATQDDCLGARICDQEACRNPCSENADCAGSDVCNTVLGTCEAPFACNADDQCGDDEICEAERCLTGCRNDDNCGQSQRCEANQCIALQSCTDETAAAACASGEVCIAGICEAACTAQTVCPGARTCNVETGRCAEPSSCTADLDCDDGRICAEALAVPTCVDACSAFSCAGQQSCGADGHCIEPDVCAANDDCLGDRVCDGGTCVYRCNGPRGLCRGADVCDDDTGLCLSPELFCDDPRDCDDGETCDAEGRCQGIECARHTDCPFICQDGLCGNPPDTSCNDVGGCGQNETCSEVGVCARLTGCLDDGDCQGFQPHCRLGRCVACIMDGDCSASEFCDAGRCLSLGSCSDDADCPGPGAQCRAGVCEPAACTPDRFDSIFATPTLVERNYGHLVLCDGDEDLYTVELGAGEGLIAVVRHDAQVGDLSLTLRTLDDEVISQNENGIARAGLSAKGLGRSVDVIVSGRSGYTTPYALEFTTTNAEDCVPDEGERLSGNGDQAQGTPVGSGQDAMTVNGCVGDVDWYGMVVPGGVEVAVRLSAVNLEAFDMTLHGLGGQAIGSSTNVDGRELVLTAQPNTETGYGLRIRSIGDAPGGSARVTIQPEVTPNAAGAACADAGSVVIGTDYWFAESLAVDRFQGSCNAIGETPEHVAMVRIEEQGTYRFTNLRNDRAGAFHLRRECDAPGSEVVCYNGFESESLELVPGDYYLFLGYTQTGPQGVRVDAVSQ